MSTRAFIRIKNKEERISLFCRWDGDPEGIGLELKGFLSRQENWSPESIAFCLLRDPGINQYFISRERLFFTDEIHGTEDYVYIIDTKTKTLKCYEHEMYETIEQCCIPSRVRKI